jgi:hypothetical protein
MSFSHIHCVQCKLQRESKSGCPFSRLRAEALWRASTGMTTKTAGKRIGIIDLFDCQGNNPNKLQEFYYGP